MAPEIPRKINGLMAVGFQESRPAKPRTTKQKTIPETKRNREMNCPLKLTDRVRVSMAPTEKKTLDKRIAAAVAFGDGLFSILFRMGIVDVLYPRCPFNPSKIQIAGGQDFSRAFNSLLAAFIFLSTALAAGSAMVPGVSTSAL